MPGPPVAAASKYFYGFIGGEAASGTHLYEGTIPIEVKRTPEKATTLWTT
jgi:hypothetical protein